MFRDDRTHHITLRNSACTELGSSMGWTNPMILAGLVIGIIALIALVKIENKAAEPLIPNENYLKIKTTQYSLL